MVASVHLTLSHHPLSILLIEDSRGDALLIEKALNVAMPEGYRLQTVSTLADALKTLSEHTFDVALLDRSLPDVEGVSGLHSVQNMAPQLPIVFLTAYLDERVAFETIEQGAQDYLYKDNIDGRIIKRAIQYAVLRKQFENLLILRANFDMLTGLANRMLFESRLDMALARMKRHGGNLAVLFMDLDRFKFVNDTYGHAEGDKLLMGVANRLKQTLRPYDTAARFGGDEFAILLENIPEMQHGTLVAEKILKLFQTPFPVVGNDVSIGISIGVTTCNATIEAGGAAIMQCADAAMYQAKSKSGNGLCCYAADKYALAKTA